MSRQFSILGPSSSCRLHTTYTTQIQVTVYAQISCIFVCSAVLRLKRTVSHGGGDVTGRGGLIHSFQYLFIELYLVPTTCLKVEVLTH